ncbi:MAG: cupin domain-containing protein [Bacteroidetes bacterium]|nr:cupin domain-containing protein [Bacteroidota bacterium]
MEELGKGLEIALKGEEAKKASDRALKQVTKWGLTMPDVSPLVLDFGLEKFNEIGEVEFWIANEAEAGYCGKYLFIDKNQTIPNHMHKEKLETFFIVKGKIQLNYDGEDRIMEQGDALRFELEKYHSIFAYEPSLVLEVSKPSIIDDNYFENTKIPIGGNYLGEKDNV